MKLKRGKMLIDPPASASSDIAFILIIFFLVCAAVQPETGLAQVLPKTEEKKEQREQSKNIGSPSHRPASSSMEARSNSPSLLNVSTPLSNRKPARPTASSS